MLSNPVLWELVKYNNIGIINVEILHENYVCKMINILKCVIKCINTIYQHLLDNVKNIDIITQYTNQSTTESGPHGSIWWLKKWGKLYHFHLMEITDYLTIIYYHPGKEGGHLACP